MSGFGLAPIKHEGMRVIFDEFGNPHPHPRSVRGRKQRTKAARSYFGWEMMHGTPVKELRRDYYWKYMES